MTEDLTAKREKLLDHIAAVALAIQASGRTEVHNDLVEILKMIPPELRRCTECGIGPGEVHQPKCKCSI